MLIKLGLIKYNAAKNFINRPMTKGLAPQRTIKGLAASKASYKYFYRPAHNGISYQKENGIGQGVGSKIIIEEGEGNKNENVNSKVSEDWGEIINKWYKQYQDFVGISEILEAQERVTQTTNQLIEVQSQRRQLQREVETANQQLLTTHQRITKSELYSEDHYKLFENARVLSSTLKNLQETFTRKEEEERDLFTHLSTAIKFCHEKERTQSENSKYWSILLSVISAALASLITSVNNWVRIKEIKEHSSNLHNEAINKSEELINNIPSVLSDSNTQAMELKLQQIVPHLQDTIIKEIQKLSLSSSVNNSADIKLQGTVRDVSYVKIVSAMAMGAALGTLITAIFLGTFSGGG